MEKKVNTTKEKKLKAIKSEILEIRDFVTSNKVDEDYDVNKDNEIEDNSNDTLTLTNIINNKGKEISINDLTDVKKQLHKLNLILTKQEIILKEILTKLK